MHLNNSYKTVLNPQFVPTDPEKPTFSVEGDSLVITSGDIRLTVTRAEAVALSAFIESHLAKSWFFPYVSREKPKQTRCYAMEA